MCGLSLLLLFSSWRSLSGQAAAPTVDYRVTPLLTQAGTASLLVSVSLIGNPSGSTSFTIPTVSPMFGKSQSEIGNFSVSGGAIVSHSSDDLVIQHVPGARLSVRYSVTSPADAEVDGSSALSSLPVRRGWFAGFGWGFLLIPKERKADQATFVWGEIPTGMKHFDTFGTGPMTVRDVEQRFIVGGSDVEEWHETLNGALLRFVGVGHLPGSSEDFRAFVRTSLIGEHQLLRDKGGDYMVTFISLPPMLAQGMISLRPDRSVVCSPMDTVTTRCRFIGVILLTRPFITGFLPRLATCLVIRLRPGISTETGSAKDLMTQ